MSEEVIPDDFWSPSSPSWKRIQKAKMLIYGFPGCGKTTAVCNAKTGVTKIPELGPVLYMDFDGQSNSVFSNLHSVTSDLNPQDIVTDKLNHLELLAGSDLELKLLQQKLEKFMSKLAADKTIGTVVVDSATNVTSLFGRYVTKNSDTKRWHPAILSEQDYGVISSFCIDFFDTLRQMDKHVILLAHVHQETTSSGAVKMEMPMFLGASRQRVPGSCHYVGRYTISANNQHSINWSSNKNMMVVKQTIELGVEDPLPTSVDFTDYAYLFKKIKG